MVRAIDSGAWRNAMFLERVRPGLAVSVILHAVLFLVLAYYLAFPPTARINPEEPSGVITVIDIPRVPPPKPQVKSTFQPQKTTELPKVPTEVPTLVIPSVVDFDKGQAKTVTTDTPPEPVIVNQRPISRGEIAYPQKALDANVPGYVDFNFTIEPDGSVGDLQLVAETPSGYGFAAAAQKAFAKWRFAPKLIDGKPVPAAARYRVSFKLN